MPQRPLHTPEPERRIPQPFFGQAPELTQTGDRARRGARVVVRAHANQRFDERSIIPGRSGMPPQHLTCGFAARVGNEREDPKIQGALGIAEVTIHEMTEPQLTTAAQCSAGCLCRQFQARRQQLRKTELPEQPVKHPLPIRGWLNLPLSVSADGLDDGKQHTSVDRCVQPSIERGCQRLAQHASLEERLHPTAMNGCAAFYLAHLDQPVSVPTPYLIDERDLAALAQRVRQGLRGIEVVGSRVKRTQDVLKSGGRIPALRAARGALQIGISRLGPPR